MRAISILIALLAAPPFSSASPVIHRVAELLNLDDKTAAGGLPCDIQATVTIYHPSLFQFFVQEGEHGAYVVVDRVSPWKLKPGDVVRLEGTSQRGAYAPVINPKRVTYISSGPLPAPVSPRTWSSVRNSDRFDGRFAEIKGRLLSVRPLYLDGGEENFSAHHLELQSNGEIVEALLAVPGGEGNLGRFIQSDVAVRGVITPSQMLHKQRHDAWIVIGSIADIREIGRKPVTWESYPKIALPRLLTHKGVVAPKGYFRTEGTVTHVDDVNTATVEEGFSMVVARQASPRKLQIGTRYEILGRLLRGERQIFFLDEAEFREIGPGSVVRPRKATASELALGELENQIVSVSGAALEIVVNHGMCVLRLQENALPWEALLPRGGGQCPTEIPAGSVVEVTGRVQHRWMDGRRFPAQTTILLRSPANIRVLSQPAWLRRLPLGKLLLGGGIVGVMSLVWIRQLRHRVRAQTSRIEQQKKDLEKAMEKVEESSRLKSEFLANMSHEIRTPMNGVLGATELLLDSELTPGQRGDLLTVRSCAGSLLGLLDDILDSAKIEAGRLSLDAVSFNLRDCIEETMRTIALVAGGKVLEFVCDIDPETPEFVIGDPVRLRQVLVNLGGNAVKFTNKGEISLHVAPEPSEAGSTLVRFTVRDTGIGIPVEKQSVIFTAFTQADASTTRRYGGTGLGLTISSRLVQMMGGRIWVESEPGQGSRFHFTARFAIPASTPCIAGARPDLTGIPVLIADAHPTTRRVLGDMVARWGMRPTLAATTEEATIGIKNATQHGPPLALVLYDLSLAEEDWAGFSEDFLSRDERAYSRVLLLSSDRERAAAACRREPRVAGYLVKPVRLGELSAAIAGALGIETARQQEPEPVKNESPVEGTAALHILVAEDNPVNQELVRRLLERMRHKVVTVDTGTEAINAAERQDFDLVLMDVQMPEMDGFEATAKLRQLEKATAGRLRIVAMTAGAMAGDRERCLAAGMDGYLSKPIRRDELERILRMVQAQAFAPLS